MTLIYNDTGDTEDDDTDGDADDDDGDLLPSERRLNQKRAEPGLFYKFVLEKQSIAIDITIAQSP